MRAPTLLAATILWGAAAGPASAQVALGVKAGVSVTGFGLTPAAPSDVLRQRTESTLGVFAGEPADRRVTWQVDLLIGPGGTTIETDDERAEYRLTYLDVAPLLRARAAGLRHGDVYVLVGPAFGVLLGATEVEYEDEGREVSAAEDLFRSLDLGITVGLGLELGRLLFEGRYRHGLTDVSAVPPSVSSEIRTRTTSVLFGFQF